MRKLLFILAILASPLAVSAQTVEEQIAAQLEAQGYVEITMSRTLLGRLRVLALSEELEREMVINPTTGQILRDFARARTSAENAPRVVVPESPASPRLRERIEERRDDRSEVREERREERQERREERQNRLGDNDGENDD